MFVKSIDISFEILHLSHGMSLDPLKKDLLDRYSLVFYIHLKQ